MKLTLKKNDTEKKPLTAAQKKKKQTRRLSYIRAGIQIVFFLLAPSLFTGAFSGIKYIFTQISSSQPIELVSFVKTLLGLCLLTMVFGRYFCGWVCAFGSLGDGVQFVSGKIQKKLKKKLPKMPDKVEKWLRCLPFVILTAIVVLSAAGIYSSLSGWSPWDVFSMVTNLNFRLSRYILGIVLLVLILLGMAWEKRFFCRFLCPMGAVFRLLPILPWAVLRRDREQCLKGCSACEKICPVKLSLGTGQNIGDCIQCGQCQRVCPRGNIQSGIPVLEKYPEAFAIGRAVVFLLAAWLLDCLRFV